MTVGSFALAIAANNPDPTIGGEDLQRKARPEGERPIPNVC